MTNKKTYLAIAGVFILIIIIFFTVFHIRKEDSATEPVETEMPEEPALPPVVTEYDIPVDSFIIKAYNVPNNKALGIIFKELGAAPEQISKLPEAANEIFDLRKIRAGNVYKAFYSINNPENLCYVVYEHSNTEFVVFELFNTGVNVLKKEKPVITKRKSAEAIITSSLWNAVQEQNINPVLGLKLSDIYAWTIDFFGLQKGDHFKVVYDEQFVDSVSIGIGRIHTAMFNSSGTQYYAFFFEQDSVGSYWNEKGESLRKAFLKAPLNFTRISSGFSYARKHPVLKTVRPHTGVDYAAPKGTPVMSIGDGTVISIGYQGGGGNTVKIRHNSVYTTAYLHLSKFANGLKNGSRVRQGDVIGYVGSTGVSTGPHLDFRVWQNGSPINPLKMESPPSEPVKEANMPAFDMVRHSYLEELGLTDSLKNNSR